MTDYMFRLILQDCKGKELKQGDIVKIVTGSNGCTFFSEVKYLKEEQAIAPFHTFSFHKFYKVDSVPENAVKSTEERYSIWYIDGEGEQYDNSSQYLIDWRACEHLLRTRCFKINPE